MSEENKEVSSDEILAVLVEMSGGELEIPIEAIKRVDIKGKYMAFKISDDQDAVVVLFVDEEGNPIE